MPGLPQLGDRFGGYRIVREVGRGGMGLVFEARQESLERTVALKVIQPLLARDPDFAARFTREARALASLQSAHIIQIFDYGEVDGCLFLATQYVPDGDLSQWLARSGPVPPLLALEILAQVASGLGDAHDQGVIHRDVKPSNILLGRKGDRVNAYLCDFGIAQQGEPGLTRTGQVAGSWAFIAPERHNGAPATVLSDIYSLGCVLWVMLTGANPYSGTDVEVAFQHVSAAIPQLPGGGWLAGELNGLIARMMAKRPEDRFRDIAELQGELVRLRQGAAAWRNAPTPELDATVERPVRRPSLARPATPSADYPQTMLRVPPADPKPGSTPPLGGSPKRNPWPVLLPLGAAVALIAIVALLVVPPLLNRPAAAGTIATPLLTQTPQAESPATLPESPSPTAESTASLTPISYTCANGQVVDDAFGCPAPEKLDGLSYMFPSFNEQRPDCTYIASQKAAITFECRVDGGIFVYRWWSSTAEALGHFETSYPNGDRESLVLAGRDVGSIYRGVHAKTGDYSMTAFLDNHFSCSVAAVTRRQAERLWRRLSVRHPADFRGYRTEAGPSAPQPLP